MGESFYRVSHATLGLALRTTWRVRTEDMDNVPPQGPGILAGNHVSYLDHFLTPSSVPRPVYYLSKAEHFEKPIQSWLFRQWNVVPIRRGSDDTGALETMEELLREGKLIGLYPEGTRSPDGRLYRGKTGAARLTLRTGAPVIPVGIIGTFEALPKGKNLPKFNRVRIRFGPPMTFPRLGPDDAENVETLRKVTADIMAAIQRLTGQEYVDAYADPKARPWKPP